MGEEIIQKHKELNKNNPRAFRPISYWCETCKYGMNPGYCDDEEPSSRKIIIVDAGAYRFECCNHYCKVVIDCIQSELMIIH